MNHLHDYLRVCGGTTVKAMLDDLKRRKRLGVPWEGVPLDAEAFVAALHALEARGLASRSGSLWIWEAEKVKEPQKERTLFA